MSVRAPLLALSTLLPVACTVNPWREREPPWTQATVAGEDDARATLWDGREIELAAPAIRGDGPEVVLVGQGDGGEQVLPLAQVARLETRHDEWLPIVADTLVITAVLTLAFCTGGDVPGLLTGPHNSGHGKHRHSGCH